MPGHRAGRGLEHTMNTERWRKLGLVSLKKRRQIGDMTAFYSSMIRGYREDEARLLSGSYGYGMRGTGHVRTWEIPFRYMEKPITMR